MQKLISAEVLEDTQTHYVLELTVEVKKLFKPNTTRKFKVFKEKRYSIWKVFNTGDYILGGIEYSLDAFTSTGKKSIIF